MTQCGVGNMPTTLLEIYINQCELQKCKKNSRLLQTLSNVPEDFSSLKELNLNLNFVGRTGVKAVLEVAKVAQCMEKLCLADNFLNNDSVKEIADAISGHKSITHLDLCKNPISHVAGKILSDLATKNIHLQVILLDDTLINPALIRIIQRKVQTNFDACRQSNGAASASASASSASVVSKPQPSTVAVASAVTAAATVASQPASAAHSHLETHERREESTPAKPSRTPEGAPHAEKSDERREEEEILRDESDTGEQRQPEFMQGRGMIILTSYANDLPYVYLLGRAAMSLSKKEKASNLENGLDLLVNAFAKQKPYINLLGQAAAYELEPEAKLADVKKELAFQMFLESAPENMVYIDMLRHAADLGKDEDEIIPVPQKFAFLHMLTDNAPTPLLTMDMLNQAADLSLGKAPISEEPLPNAALKILTDYSATECKFVNLLRLAADLELTEPVKNKREFLDLLTAEHDSKAMKYLNVLRTAADLPIVLTKTDRVDKDSVTTAADANADAETSSSAASMEAMRHLHMLTDSCNLKYVDVLREAADLPKNECGYDEESNEFLKLLVDAADEMHYVRLLGKAAGFDNGTIVINGPGKTLSVGDVGHVHPHDPNHIAYLQMLTDSATANDKYVYLLGQAAGINRLRLDDDDSVSATNGSSVNRNGLLGANFFMRLVTDNAKEMKFCNLLAQAADLAEGKIHTPAHKPNAYLHLITDYAAAELHFVDLLRQAADMEDNSDVDTRNRKEMRNLLMLTGLVSEAPKVALVAQAANLLTQKQVDSIFKNHGLLLLMDSADDMPRYSYINMLNDAAELPRRNAETAEEGTDGDSQHNQNNVALLDISHLADGSHFSSLSHLFDCVEREVPSHDEMRSKYLALMVIGEVAMSLGADLSHMLPPVEPTPRPAEENEEEAVAVAMPVIESVAATASANPHQQHQHHHHADHHEDGSLEKTSSANLSSNSLPFSPTLRSSSIPSQHISRSSTLETLIDRDCLSLLCEIATERQLASTKGLNLLMASYVIQPSLKKPLGLQYLDRASNDAILTGMWTLQHAFYFDYKCHGLQTLQDARTENESPRDGLAILIQAAELQAHELPDSIAGLQKEDEWYSMKLVWHLINTTNEEQQGKGYGGLSSVMALLSAQQ